MPRTRTKFLWPPANLAGDHSAEQQQQQQQPQKKQKLESSEQLPSNPHTRTMRWNNDNSPAPSDARESTQSSQAEWDPTSNDAPSSFEAVFRSYLQIPLEKVIKNYQNWRRHGSVHDDYCMMCQRPRPAGLVPCYTCRRSFHDECMPQGSLYNDLKQWYCAVCVQRNWHVHPPTMTPPASPPRLSAQLPTESAHNAPGTDIKPVAHETTAEDSQALSILAEISRSMHRDVSHSQPPSHNHDNNHNNSNNNTGNTRNSDMAIPKPSARPGPLAQPSPSTQSFSMLDSHARKSRFATLSSEVDSALWVLYRELESATSLRQRIVELEAEVVKLRQDVSIRDNQIILSQRSAQASPVSQVELEQLRTKAANWDARGPELEQLRAKNDALEQKLRDAYAECASKDEALNEWKGRLASLIGP